MENTKGKNIAFLIGVYEGHFTSTVGIVKELVDLGYNVTCFVNENFTERIKKTGAKLKIYTIDQNDISKTPSSILCLTVARSIDAILTEALKNPEKYDFLVVDSVFDGNEMNKIFKARVVAAIYTAMTTPQFFEILKSYNDVISQIMIPINKKFNLNMKNLVVMHTAGDIQYKLMLTSKEFHLKGDFIDNTFYFIGPSPIEKRPKDESFSFKKDSNKKLIYISLGTIFNRNLNFFNVCIDAFRDSEEFQIIMSVGKVIDVKTFENVPKNFKIYNYVPQHQVLEMADVFISHGGLNSINERLILNEKPIIIIPQDGDQFFNANSITEFGAGISMLTETINVEKLKDAVNSILTDEEKYIKGVRKILQGFKEARKERENLYKKIFV